MPNWSFNTAEINGSKKDIQSFLEKAKGENGVLDFNSFIPQPDNIFRGDLGTEEKRKCKEQGVPNWYDWNIDNWDTKWNACDAYIEEDKDNIRISFNTAWSPPYKVFVAVVKQHPELSFQFLCDIEGVEFAVSCSLYGTSFNAYIHPLQYVCAETDEPIHWDGEKNYFVTEDGREVDDWFSYVDWDNYEDVELIAEIYEEDITEA